MTRGIEGKTLLAINIFVVLSMVLYTLGRVLFPTEISGIQMSVGVEPGGAVCIATQWATSPSREQNTALPMPKSDEEAGDRR